YSKLHVFKARPNSVGVAYLYVSPLLRTSYFLIISYGSVNIPGALSLEKGRSRPTVVDAQITKKKS
ncbi:MAG: hypothetical protein ACOC3T_05680, partial [Bacteroidota bacterium]